LRKAAETALDEEDDELGRVAWRLAEHANTLEATMELPPRSSRSLAPVANDRLSDWLAEADRLLDVPRLDDRHTTAQCKACNLHPQIVVESNNSGRAVDRMIAIARRLHSR